MKMIFFDIDGTLLDEDTRTVPESTVRSLRQAKENGHQIFVCTGRCRNIWPLEVMEIGFDGVVGGCGTNIFYRGEELLHTSLDPALQREIADDLTYYFAASEQVPSCVALGILMERNNTVKQAGGFIIQLMPFAQEEVIRKLEENVAGLKSVTTLLEEGNTPEQILSLLLGDMGLEITEKTPVRFWCGCSKERVEKVLYSLKKEDLQEMAEEGKDVELHCHFCNTNYVFTADELKKMV